MHSVLVGCVFDTSDNLYASIFRVEFKGRRSIQDIQVENPFPSIPLEGKREPHSMVSGTRSGTHGI